MYLMIHGHYVLLFLPLLLQCISQKIQKSQCTGHLGGCYLVTRTQEDKGLEERKSDFFKCLCIPDNWKLCYIHKLSHYD